MERHGFWQPPKCSGKGLKVFPKKKCASTVLTEVSVCAGKNLLGPARRIHGWRNTTGSSIGGEERGAFCHVARSLPDYTIQFLQDGLHGWIKGCVNKSEKKVYSPVQYFRNLCIVSLYRCMLLIYRLLESNTSPPFVHQPILGRVTTGTERPRNFCCVQTIF